MKKQVLAFILTIAVIITSFPLTAGAYPSGVTLFNSDGKSYIFKKDNNDMIDRYRSYIGDKNGVPITSGEYSGLEYVSVIDNINRSAYSGTVESTLSVKNKGKPSGRDTIIIGALRKPAANGKYTKHIQVLNTSGKVLATYDDLISGGCNSGYLAFRSGETFHIWTVAGKYLGNTKDLTRVVKTVKRDFDISEGAGVFPDGILFYPVYASADTVVYQKRGEKRGNLYYYYGLKVVKNGKTIYETDSKDITLDNGFAKYNGNIVLRKDSKAGTVAYFVPDESGKSKKLADFGALDSLSYTDGVNGDWVEIYTYKSKTFCLYNIKTKVKTNAVTGRFAGFDKNYTEMKVYYVTDDLMAVTDKKAVRIYSFDAKTGVCKLLT